MTIVKLPRLLNYSGVKSDAQDRMTMRQFYATLSKNSISDIAQKRKKMKIRNYFLVFLTSITLHAMEDEKDLEFIGEQLKAAIISDNLAAVTILLTDVEDINAYGKDVGLERPALSYAALHGKSRIVNLLLDNGAHIDVTDESLHTPLHDAVQWSQGITIQCLLARKAPIDVRNRWLQTPLLAALDQDTPSYEIVELLLQYHANPNLSDDQGDTAAHYAYGRNRMDLVELLKKHNANFELENKNGTKPIDLKPESDEEKSVSTQEESDDEIEEIIEKPIGITLTNETFDEALGYFFQNRHIRNTLHTYYYLIEAETVKDTDPQVEGILGEPQKTNKTFEELIRELEEIVLY